MKKLILIAALAATFAVLADDTDCGAIVTTGNIADVAKVENLAGNDAGKATVTIKDNSGNDKSVTVYNAATIDSALSGKASTGDVSALAARATALENATNNLTVAVGQAASAADTAYANATNSAAQTYVKKTGDSMSGSLSTTGSNVGFNVVTTPNNKTQYQNGKIIVTPSVGESYTIDLPAASGRAALRSDITNDVPAWARAANKPSYNFSEIGSKPTTIAGYGITDAKISNGTITLGSNTITPVTAEADPVWASEKSGYVPTSRTVAGMALSSDINLKNLSIVGSSTTTYNGSGTASVNQTEQTQTSTTQNGTTGKNLTIKVAATSLDMGAYYIKIGTDGKPHLMLRQ